jgi:hypothetical protein
VCRPCKLLLQWLVSELRARCSLHSTHLAPAAPCCARLLPKLPNVGENVLSATGWNTLCVVAAAFFSSAGAAGGSSRSQMGTYGLSACWALLRPLLAAAEREAPLPAALSAVASPAAAPGLGRASRLLNLLVRRL